MYRGALFSPGAGAAAAAASLGAALILHATLVVLGLPLSGVLAVSLCSAVVRAARQSCRKLNAICTGRRAATIREMNTAPTCMRVLSGVPGVRPLLWPKARQLPPQQQQEQSCSFSRLNFLFRFSFRSTYICRLRTVLAISASCINACAAALQAQ